jgi:hypothetical protein
MNFFHWRLSLPLLFLLLMLALAACSMCMIFLAFINSNPSFILWLVLLCGQISFCQHFLLDYKSDKLNDVMNS